MRLLLDENLPPRVARMLQQAGHDAAHVTEVGLGNTTATSLRQRPTMVSRS